MEKNTFGKNVFSTIVICGVGAILWSKLYGSSESDTIREISTPRDYNPCCEFPCLNMGVCMNSPNNTYYCDCTGTGYSGLNCHIPSLMESIKKKLKPSPEFLHHFLTSYPNIFILINSISALHKILIKYVYMSRGSIIDSPPRFESDHEYVTLDSYLNESYYVRTLPPVPRDCPTPMGVKGPKKLVEPAELFRRVFLRREFNPEPHNSNLLFQYYAQHYSHQFFRSKYSTNGILTDGTGCSDAGHIYGLTEEIRRGLRSKVDGKLKTQVINGEEFPPLLKDVEGLSMNYPPNVPIPEEAKFALGNPFFSLLPGLFVFATIWAREHNRACDVLKKEHPHWDDERLYQTARLIILGESIKITIEEYVQHLSQYKLNLTFEPELVHGTNFQFHNRISAEFDQMYHWHPLVPDGIQVDDKYYTIPDMIFSNTAVFEHGLEKFVEALATSRAGALTIRNHPDFSEAVFKKSISNSRLMRFPGFNEYRKRFGMNPYRSFEELTGEKELSKELEDMYGHIDAVEFYVGLLAESPTASIMGLTMINTGGPWSIKGLMSNPICSPHWWKPSTFGGDVGFDIIKTASLKNLFCRNMKGNCGHIAFTVPDAE